MNGRITNKSAALIGFSLVMMDSMMSGLASTLTPKSASRQGASEKAFQGKVVALLDRYSLNQKALEVSGQSRALPPALTARGHQFLADALELSSAYEKSHSTGTGDGTLGTQMKKDLFPIPATCDFHVLSPTRVQIVPHRDPKSLIEARLEDGRWRINLADEASSPRRATPKIKTLTPQAAAFIQAIQDRDLAAVGQKLKAAPSLANTPSGFYHGQSGSVSDTPLLLAAFEGDPKIAALLIQYGADVNAEDDFGKTALDRAARFGSQDVAELLLAHGARVDHKNDLGETALHQAVEGDDAGTVSLLLTHGADVNARDNDGKTPLAVALAFPSHSVDHAAIIKLLRLRGAKK